MIIQIKVQKGGTGKTFVAANLAHLLSQMDKKVLLLTTDSQNSIYSVFEKEKRILTDTLKLEKGLYTSIKKMNTENKIKLRKNLDFIPYDSKNYKRIQKEIEDFFYILKKEYDYIIIDSTPTFELDKVFLEYVDKILIVAHGDKLTIQGAISIINTVPEKIAAIIFNKYANTNLNKEYFELIKKIIEHTNIKLIKIRKTQYIVELMERSNTVWESKSGKIEDIKQSFIDILKSLF